MQRVNCNGKLPYVLFSLFYNKKTGKSRARFQVKGDPVMAKAAEVPKSVLSAFGLEENAKVSAYGNGHIHNTFLVEEEERKFILQKLNTVVFPDYESVMSNIELVTAFIGKKMADRGKKESGTLTVVPTVDGTSYVALSNKDGTKDIYRVFVYIDGESRDQPDALSLQAAGRAFGEFQNLLADFPVEQLAETIPHFHDTPKRYENLRAAIDKDAFGRLDSCRDMVALAEKLSWLTPLVTDGIREKTIPLRVTHNDTKLNNLLFRRGTDEVVAVVDLDTVMPGSLLYDFGDSLRCGMATSPEDGDVIEDIGINLGYYEAFACGFLSETGKGMTEKEKELLPVSPLLMTYEVGIRFLTDYLSGDVYFHTRYEGHNLVRARNQLILTERMAEALPEMKRITEELIAHL